MKRRNILKFRKAHRYLGIFLGLQFIMWTISGLYFSWTNLDEIHGDHLKNIELKSTGFNGLISPTNISNSPDIHTLELRDIAGTPYYFINGKNLYNAKTGEPKTEISQEEALLIANKHMKPELNVKSIDRIESAGKHHEYREKLLPAYVVSYDGKIDIKTYISSIDGRFQTVRHRDWRIFDFLWMTHTMDYEGRDDFNNIALRIFSLAGLITVLSGFILFFITSATMRRIFIRK